MSASDYKPRMGVSPVLATAEGSQERDRVRKPPNYETDASPVRTYTFSCQLSRSRASMQCRMETQRVWMNSLV